MVLSNIEVNEALRRLLGRSVWFVNAGGSAGSTFSLSVGEKVPRAQLLDNPSVPELFRTHQGEATLYVWCTWRLHGADALASSDQEASLAVPALETLNGEVINEAKASGPCLDLSLTVGNTLLEVFCDHVPPDPSFDANWELVWSSGLEVVAGPGLERTLKGTP